MGRVLGRVLFSPWSVLALYQLTFLLLIGDQQLTWSRLVMTMIGVLGLIMVAVCEWQRQHQGIDHNFWLRYQSLYGALAFFSVFFSTIAAPSLTINVSWLLGTVLFFWLMYWDQRQ